MRLKYFVHVAVTAAKKNIFHHHLIKRDFNLFFFHVGQFKVGFHDIPTRFIPSSFINRVHRDQIGNVFR